MLLAVSYLRVSTREQAERGGTEEGSRKTCGTVLRTRDLLDALGNGEAVWVRLTVKPSAMPGLGDVQHPLDELAEIASLAGPSNSAYGRRI
jgi:hypothetical protein